MKTLLAASMLLFTACTGGPSVNQLQPALENAAILKVTFEHGMTANETLVGRGNMTTEARAAYNAGQAHIRSLFNTAYDAHTRHLASWAGLNAAEFTAMLDAVTTTALNVITTMRTPQ